MKIRGFNVQQITATVDIGGKQHPVTFDATAGRLTVDGLTWDGALVVLGMGPSATAEVTELPADQPAAAPAPAKVSGGQTGRTSVAKTEQPAPAEPEKLADTAVVDTASEEQEFADVEYEVDDALRGARQLKEVVQWFTARGCATAGAVLAGIEQVKAEVPLLAKATNLNDRVVRVMEMLA